ncbi:MAG: hypothetical protein ACKVHE_36835 [Planctomycetales bacterium]
MTYARSRLWLGITAVGTLQMVAILLLLTGFHLEVLHDFANTNINEFGILACIVLTTGILLAPFDLLGGFILPRRFGRESIRFTRFTLAWSRGVAVQSVCLIASLWSVLQAGQLFGLAGSLTAVLTIQFLMLYGQKMLAIVTGSLSFAPAGPVPTEFHGRPVSAASHRDSGFTGSIVGLPGAENIVMPASWSTNLTREQLNAEVVRRWGAIRTGSRTRGIFLAVLINTGTFGMSALMPNAGVTTVAELLSTTLYFTLASFIWLLILPRLSREGVFESDRFAFDSGIPVREIESAANRIEALHDNEPERSRRLESIFHPVPCVRRRVAELSLRLRSIHGFWNVARTTLFLSWACGGFLARAVHCNIGRPELWVLFPTD